MMLPIRPGLQVRVYAHKPHPVPGRARFLHARSNQESTLSHPSRTFAPLGRHPETPCLQPPIGPECTHQGLPASAGPLPQPASPESTLDRLMPRNLGAGPLKTNRVIPGNKVNITDLINLD